MVFPYLKGFDIIKWWFSILFHISCVVIVFRYLWYYCGILYSGIWPLAKERNLYLLFLHNFSREEKEGGTLQVHI
jgi:hypothetical protein